MFDRDLAPRPAIIAAPMHGEVKMRGEGLRTRDGHILEWFSKLRPDSEIVIHSRAEPWPRLSMARRGGVPLPEQFQLNSPQPLAIPSLRNRRNWWVKSVKYRTQWSPDLPAIAWNPIETASAIRNGEVSRTLVFDLLDDWMKHSLFESFRLQIEDAYRTIFASADFVTANSEGTVALAKSFGRDAELIPNGVDPERFKVPNQPSTGEIIVGYGGKIGSRLDLALIEEVTRALPNVSFELAGPIIEAEAGERLGRIENVRLLGDIRYDRYPEIFMRWDVAWVPHLVGAGEVGGDAIKIYEYRAAGLPTFSTRIIGWQRFMEGVRVPEEEDFTDALASYVKRLRPGGANREPIEIPESATWKFKASRLLSLLDA